MSHNPDHLDYPDEFDYQIHIKQRARPTALRNPNRQRTHAEMRAELPEPDPLMLGTPKPRRTRREVFAQLAEDNRAKSTFNPTIGSFSSGKNHISNHEREWILSYLGGFYEDRLITDILRRVKGGKEATVYCCRADSAIGGDLIAGKVYHQREFRKLKNDSLYREGRAVLDDQGKGVRGRREVLAMKKKTGFGQELRHFSWLANEYQALEKLHASGADVPKPFTYNDNAMLMEYLGEERWAAPTLVNVTLPTKEARSLFDRLVYNVELMLAQQIVHGDLSAHNILYWDGQAKIIDFPQAVDPYINPSAFSLFSRDVQRLCQYFARYGIRTDPLELARELWTRYMSI
jgi:RIO kinase 1